MAGKSLILKKDQILFNEGDDSNGMFLVRKGSLTVFLEQDGREVVLANVETGGMIGEMALFDKKPRSASVKAASQTEITHITDQDFNKLIKQVPKWFTALMGTLSNRLRTTNERLQQMEIKSTPERLSSQSTLRILGVLDLLWHRDGIKEGKDWLLEKAPTVLTLTSLFSEDPKTIDKILNGLIKTNFIGIKHNSYKNEMLSVPNRATLRKFILFLSQFLQQSNQGSLPQAGIDLLKAFDLFSESSAYEKVTASLSELTKLSPKIKSKTAPQWPHYAKIIAKIHKNEIKIVKASGGELGLRSCKKEIKEITKYHLITSALL